MKYKSKVNRICFLSPHSDDTFLELYHAISNRVLQGEYYLCTVFADSNYVDCSQTDVYKDDDISEMRKNEDAVFAKKMGMHYFFLKEPDCLLRFGDVYFDECHHISKEIITSISEKLTACLEERNIDCIIAPFPYGRKQHYDHRLLCEIAQNIAKCKQITLLWTNDIPYSSVPLDKVKRCLWHKKLTREQVLDKVSNLDQIYPSQTCDYYKNAICDNNESIFVL